MHNIRTRTCIFPCIFSNFGLPDARTCSHTILSIGAIRLEVGRRGTEGGRRKRLDREPMATIETKFSVMRVEHCTPDGHSTHLYLLMLRSGDPSSVFFRD